MSKIVKEFDHSVCFWDICPAMKISEVAGQMYKSDKTRGKRVSSDKMWVTALLWDIDSIYYDVPNKIEIVANEFLEGKVKQWNKERDHFLKLKAEYETIQDTPLIRTLKVLNSKLSDRIKFLEETEYGIENIKILDDAAINTSKIAKTIGEIEIQVGLEQAKSKGKGDSLLSLTDENKI